MLKKISIFLFLPLFIIANSITAQAKDFTYENLLYALYKINNDVDYELIADSYMKSFRASIWRKYKNDEFELEDKRRDTIEILKNKIANYDITDPFKIRTNVDFDKYNFKELKFNFTPIAPNTYFYESMCCNELPRQIKIMITNGSIIDGIPMKKEAAKKFLNSRKGYGGHIDRTVTLTLEILPKNISDINTITSEIISYKVVDPKTNQTLLSWKK